MGGVSAHGESPTLSHRAILSQLSPWAPVGAKASDAVCDAQMQLVMINTGPAAVSSGRGSAELLFEQTSQPEIDVNRDRHEAACARVLCQTPRDRE